jgi:integrase
MLTATKIGALRGAEKPYKVGDRDGLYLDVRPNGSKYWRFRYRFRGRQKLLALGVYPAVSLAMARDRTKAARDALQEGIDPAVVKRRLKQKTSTTFRALAEEWHETQRHLWTERHADRVLKSLKDNVFGDLGSEPAEDITPQDLLACLRKIENRSALETASRVLQRCSAVYRYAIASGTVTYNPAADLKGALKAPKFQHYKALDRKGLSELLKKLDEYDGDPVTKCAVRFMALTFVRTGELRFAKWDEIDWDGQLWRIPADRMKMKRDHLVPLSNQAVDVLICV